MVSRNPVYNMRTQARFETVDDLTRRLQDAVVSANGTVIALTAKELTRTLGGPNLINALNAEDLDELKGNVLKFLKATDVLVSVFEENKNPTQVNLSRLAVQITKLFSELKSRYESASKSRGVDLEPAVTAEMAAHTLSRAWILREGILRHADQHRFRPDGAFMALESILADVQEIKSETAVIQRGEEVLYQSVRTATSKEPQLYYLYKAGVHYRDAARGIPINHNNSAEALQRAMDFSATAAVILREAGVNHADRFAIVGDCEIVAQQLACAEIEGIPPDLSERVSEIRRTAIEGAKARYLEFGHQPLSVDGILRE